MLLEDLPHWFVVLTAVTLGLNIGSFLNVVIYRLPLGMSLAHPGSQCPACDTPIPFYNNIPVLSWILLRGRASCCDVSISPRYPLIELIGGLMAWAIIVARIEPHAETLYLGEATLLFCLYLALGLGLVAAAAIDFEHMILPDSLTWGGAALGFFSSPFRPELDPPMDIVGALVGYFGIWLPFIWAHTKLRGFPGMGLGDAKLMALAGAWFGPWGVLFTLYAGAMQGTVFAGISWLTRGKLEEPTAVREQREELLQAISEATGQEKVDLQKELDDDPLGRPPEESPARIAFGPFLALALIELMLFYEVVDAWLSSHLYF